MFKRLILPLVVLVALVVLYFWAALKWSYSSGERAGWVQKLSNKGWICKTWEGELALVSLPGSTAEKFLFTVRDDAVAQQITRHMGKRVTLHYEEKVGLPTECFGETRHFITGITLAEEIPIGPGVVVPTAPAGAPSAPSARFSLRRAQGPGRLRPRSPSCASRPTSRSCRRSGPRSCCA